MGESQTQKAVSQSASAKKTGILIKLVGMLLAIFLIPVAFIILLFFTTTAGLGEIEDENDSMVQTTKNTSDQTKTSKQKSEKELESMMKLNILNVTGSIAGKVELIFEANKLLAATDEDTADLLEDHDEIPDYMPLINLIRSEKIGNSGNVSIIDPRNNKVILDQTVEYEEKISDKLPYMWRLIKNKEYLKKLDELDRQKELAEQGLGGGLANKRTAISDAFEEEEGLEEGDKVVSFFVITPISGTPFSLASKSSLGGLTKTIMEGISEALEKVEKNVEEVKLKSENVKNTSKKIESKYRNQVFLTIVLGALSIIVIGFFLRKAFIAPISHLTNTAAKIETGDLEVRTKVKTGDELQILGDSFNSMLDRIVNQIQSLDKIVKTGKDISATMEIDSLLDLVCNEISSMTKSDSATIYLCFNTEEDNYQLSLEGLPEEELTYKCLKTVGSHKFAEFVRPSDTLIGNLIEARASRQYTKGEKINSILIDSGPAIVSPFFNTSSDEEGEESTGPQLIGFLILSGRSSDYAQEDLSAVKTIVTNIEIQLMNINLLSETADKARMDAELKTAQAVQAALFPDKDPETDQISLSGFFQSSSETGGDWYGYVYEEDKIHILIGDVTGHGTPAALVTASVCGTCTSLQSFLDQSMNLVGKEKGFTFSPSFILKNLNEAVYQTGRQKFVMTFFCATFEIKTGKLTFANAGHNSPWILRDSAIEDGETLNPLTMDKKVGVLAARGNRLGFNRDAVFKEKTTYLKPNDIVVFFTDGLIECENNRGEEYGKKKSRKILVSNRGANAEDIKNHLVADAFDFYGDHPRKDDVTILILKVPETAKFESDDNENLKVG